MNPFGWALESTFKGQSVLDGTCLGAAVRRRAAETHVCVAARVEGWVHVGACVRVAVKGCALVLLVWVTRVGSFGRKRLPLPWDLTEI